MVVGIVSVLDNNDIVWCVGAIDILGCIDKKYFNLFTSVGIIMAAMVMTSVSSFPFYAGYIHHPGLVCLRMCRCSVFAVRPSRLLGLRIRIFFHNVCAVVAFLHKFVRVFYRRSSVWIARYARINF